MHDVPVEKNLKESRRMSVAIASWQAPAVVTHQFLTRKKIISPSLHMINFLRSC